MTGSVGRHVAVLVRRTEAVASLVVVGVSGAGSYTGALVIKAAAGNG